MNYPMHVTAAYPAPRRRAHTLSRVREALSHRRSTRRAPGGRAAPDNGDGPSPIACGMSRGVVLLGRR